MDAPSTGFPALDRALGGLRDGDNVVWQVESLDDYARLVSAFVDRAVTAGRPVVYFRFARHAPLVPARAGVREERLSAAVGFESFTAAIHAAVDEAGRGAFHVFDCLSELAADWTSDLMLGNFFTVTCPYLYALDTVAYFGLLRGSHSRRAVDAIRGTTQLLVDVYRNRGHSYVHPLKVDARSSPTMYLPHQWEGEAFRALTRSAELAQTLAEVAARADDSPPRDVWDRRFDDARAVRAAAERGERSWADDQASVRGLLRMVVTRDERFAALAARHLDLLDLLAIRRRMIGTGLVGGKAAGMLVARAILEGSDPGWRRRLEPHDSWFIGSDVFHTFLVRNGLWQARRGQRSRASYLDGAAEARERVLAGRLPAFVERRLVAMLDAFGQSPIIVRSSSLLEDGFGNAFTGKYESVFLPNQGPPAERLEALLAAIRAVYASTMSEEALRYRERRGLLDRDEQMAVLVQRVSGAVHGRLFYPQLASVALSYNPYVWTDAIDARAGVLRLVFGLGTRAVERADDDYTRIVALNAPALRPEASLDLAGDAEHAQRRVDVIDLEARRFVSMPLDEVVRESPGLPVHLVARPRGPGSGWLLTFEEVLWRTAFVEQARAMLSTLRDAYGTQVDVELTANFLDGDELRVNLVQCRPLQVSEGSTVEEAPAFAPGALVLASRGPVVGQGRSVAIDRVVYVDADAYAALGTQDRHEVARVVGRATRLEPKGERRVLVIGPGRWGTGTPTLGVPVSFPEIQRAEAIVEVMKLGDLVPDVSLGSHFFNDLVEENILYVALHPGYPGRQLDDALLRAAPSRLPELLPRDARMAELVRIVDFPLPGDPRSLWLHADSERQEVRCGLR